MSYTVLRGEDEEFEHTVTATSGALVDLTDAEIYWRAYGLDGVVVLEKKSLQAGGSAAEIEIPAQTGDDLGKFTVLLSTADVDIEQTARWVDCFVVTEPGEHIKVCDHRPFYVTGNAPPTFV